MIPDVTVFADIRCLQDPALQFRGVGQHVSSLLRGRKRTGIPTGWRLVGLVSDDMPPLPENCRSLVDDLSPCLNPAVPREGAIFLSLSPMTHSPDVAIRFIGHARVLSAAVIYDFIPWDWPGYLPSISSRMDYLARIAQLKPFDLFFPISQYSGTRLSQLTGVTSGRITSTGAAVRNSIRCMPDGHGLASKAYAITVGGDDRRKNIELAIRAVGLFNSRHNEAQRLRLIVVGRYGPEYGGELKKIAAETVAPDLIEFRSDLSDADLGRLYANAVVTIVPSHIEGFSLTVTEAATCGCPVLASTCAAHMELISQPEALFASHDAAELCDRLHKLVHDSGLRRQIIDQQESLADRFTEERVQDRFWPRVMNAFERGRASNRFSTGAAKPKVAVLSPYPPDRSGVARFTELTLQACKGVFNIDLYTDAPRPLPRDDGFRDAGTIGRTPLARGYDGIISVLGNSHYHLSAFRFFERYGGPCILHDSRLTHFFHWMLGPTGFLQMATEVTGQPCSTSDLPAWFEERCLPTLFVEPVLRRAHPLIVHTAAYQRVLRERYGFAAELAVFPPNMYFTRAELSAESRAAARRRLGFAEDTFVISSFGFITPNKGGAICILALAFLRAWGILAELHFVGDAGESADELRQLALRQGVAEYLHLGTTFVDAAVYRDYMLASDAAVQLRSYCFGQPSAALADCISAGLPVVASADLADACDAPSYVVRVPDATSPLIVAEALASLQDRRDRGQDADEQRSWLDSHNFDIYARRLQRILGFG